MSTVNIIPTSKQAKGYGNNIINFHGEVSLKVNYSNINIVHKFLVVGKNNVSLLGRDLCRKLNIQMSIPDVDNDGKIKHVHNILHSYSDFLSDKFISSVKDTVSLSVNTNTKPIFCKTRPVPFRYKELVKLRDFWSLEL